MPHTTQQVSVEVLQDFADAWNRHDVDDLMTFIPTTASSRALQGLTFPALDMSVAKPCERVSLRSSRPLRTHIGAMPATSSAVREASRNGLSRGPIRTAGASKFIVAICSCFETARLR